MNEESAALVQYRLRQTADYRALQSSSREQARETLAKAVRFVQCLKEYLSG